MHRDALESAVLSHMFRLGTPGLALALCQLGERRTVLALGFASLEFENPLRTEALFPLSGLVASLTQVVGPDLAPLGARHLRPTEADAVVVGRVSGYCATPEGTLRRAALPPYDPGHVGTADDLGAVLSGLLADRPIPRRELEQAWAAGEDRGLPLDGNWRCARHSAWGASGFLGLAVDRPIAVALLANREGLDLRPVADSLLPR